MPLSTLLYIPISTFSSYLSFKVLNAYFEGLFVSTTKIQKNRTITARYFFCVASWCTKNSTAAGSVTSTWMGSNSDRDITYVCFGESKELKLHYICRGQLAREAGEILAQPRLSTGCSPQSQSPWYTCTELKKLLFDCCHLCRMQCTCGLCFDNLNLWSI